MAKAFNKPSDFLKAFDAEGRHNLVAIPLDGAPVGQTFQPGDWTGIDKFAERWNGQANLYFSVNEPAADAPHGKLRAAQIGTVRAVVADIDSKEGEKIDDAIARGNQVVDMQLQQPTFTTDSGGGVQAFWLLKEKIPSTDPATAKVYELNGAMADALDSDPAVKDLARIMRLPGTLNLPTEKKRAKNPDRTERSAKVQISTGPRYELAALAEAYPTTSKIKVSGKTNTAMIELDRPASIEKATDWLQNFAPEAIEGAGGEPKTFEVAARMRDFGISETFALDLLLDHWNEQKASPPWQPADLQEKVANAYSYGQNPLGARLAKAEFGEIDLGEDEARKAASKRRLDIFAASEFAGTAPPSREWLVEDLIPHKNVTLLYGDGGTGKSLLALQLAVAVASGTDWLQKTPRTGACLFISAEDDKDEIHRRLAAIAAGANIDLSTLSTLHVVTLVGDSAVLAASNKTRSYIQPTTLFAAVEAAIVEHKPVLVVLDTLADTFGGDENVRGHVRQFVGFLRGWATKHGCTVLMLAHPSQTGLSSKAGTSGSTAWSNSARSRLYLERVLDGAQLERDPDIRILRTKKLNYGPVGGTIRCRWQAGLFTTKTAQQTESDKSALIAQIDETFLELVERYHREGRPVSASPSSIYAPRLFAKDGSHAGFTASEYTDSMNRLLAAGQLVNVTEGPPSKRRHRLRSAAACSNPPSPTASNPMPT